jgi:hypothetical protein
MSNLEEHTCTKQRDKAAILTFPFAVAAVRFRGEMRRTVWAVPVYWNCTTEGRVKTGLQLR